MMLVELRHRISDGDNPSRFSVNISSRGAHHVFDLVVGAVLHRVPASEHLGDGRPQYPRQSPYRESRSPRLNGLGELLPLLIENVFSWGQRLGRGLTISANLMPLSNLPGDWKSIDKAEFSGISADS
jgi:hypothetical protein